MWHDATQRDAPHVPALCMEGKNWTSLDNMYWDCFASWDSDLLDNWDIEWEWDESSIPKMSGTQAKRGDMMAIELQNCLPTPNPPPTSSSKNNIKWKWSRGWIRQSSPTRWKGAEAEGGGGKTRPQDLPKKKPPTNSPPKLVVGSGMPPIFSGLPSRLVLWPLALLFLHPSMVSSPLAYCLLCHPTCQSGPPWPWSGGPWWTWSTPHAPCVGPAIDEAAPAAAPTPCGGLSTKHPPKRYYLPFI